MRISEVIAFHGTEKPKIFTKQHAGNNSHTFGAYNSTRYGTFFSDNREFAKIYGNHVRDFKLNINNIADNLPELAYRYYNEDPDNLRETDRSLWLDFRNVRNEWMLFEDDMGEIFVPWLIEQGYDGAKFEEWHEVESNEISGTTYVVFDPVNIIPINRRKQLDMFAINK